jgi:hypothetical protein
MEMKIANPLRSLFIRIRDSEIAVSCLVFVFIGSLLVWLNYKFGISFSDIQVEAHGLLMDVVVFGILILWINKVRDWHNLRLRYHEESDDFRDWKSDEAKYRILGSIKRLVRLGERRIDVNRAYLSGIHLENFSFEDANFNCTDLSEAYISGCSFKRVDFTGASFAKATIRCSSFYGCKLDSTNFFDVILYDVDFAGSDLAHFDQSNNLDKARVIYNPKNLDESLWSLIRDKRPDLLEKPDFEKMNRWIDAFRKKQNAQQTQ